MFAFLPHCLSLNFLPSVSSLTSDHRNEYNPIVEEEEDVDEQAVVGHEEIHNEVEQLHLIMEKAAAFFSDNLWDEEDGLRGREKLTELGIPEEIWEKSELGYALPKWNDLKNVLGYGCTIDDLIALGLVVEGSKKTYDRFRDRVILPLRDTNGRPIGFRGLAIDGAPNSIGSKIHDLFDSPAPTSFGVGDWAKPFYS